MTAFGINAEIRLVKALNYEVDNVQASSKLFHHLIDR